jgi:hypothetical protein
MGLGIRPIALVSERSTEHQCYKIIEERGSAGITQTELGIIFFFLIFIYFIIIFVFLCYFILFLLFIIIFILILFIGCYVI